MLKREKEGKYQRSNNGDKKCQVYIGNIPVGEITKDEMYRLADSAGKKVVYVKGDRKIGLGNVYCIVKKEIYFTIKKDEWREAKREERNKKALEESYDNAGDKKITDKSCGRTKNKKVTRKIAVQLVGDYYDSAQYKPGLGDDPEKVICKNELLAELQAALDTLTERDREIMELFSNQYVDAEIGKKIGMSQRGVNKRKKAIFIKLREILKKIR